MQHKIILTSGVGLGIAIGAFTIGCSATPPDGTFSNSGGSAGSGNVGGSAGQAGSGGSGGEGGFNFPMDDGGAGGPPQLPGEVFGHSSDTLYKLEPYSKQVTVIGPFQGCSTSSIWPSTKIRKIIGTSYGGLYWIDKTSAKCTQISSGTYPNSLSFVPAGTLDPNNEALVGYQGSDYIRISTTTGQVTVGGKIGNGYLSSGDIVSVKGGGTYLTVKGNGCGDCLLEVDPKTGGMVKNWGSTGYGSVFGIAFWAGSVYGFTDYGQLSR